MEGFTERIFVGRGRTGSAELPPWTAQDVQGVRADARTRSLELQYKDVLTEFIAVASGDYCPNDIARIVFESASVRACAVLQLVIPRPTASIRCTATESNASVL